MAFKIHLKPSGHTFEVEHGEKILKAGLNAGLSMPYSCRMGMCTTCRGKVVEGQVDLGDVHPSYLTPEHRAKGFALLCQAKALSDLVVEIDELPRLVPPQTFPAMVKQVSKVAPDVMIVNLRLPLHQNLMFAAGQYIDLILDDEVRRSYSLANAPAVPEGVIDLQLHIRHTPGGLFTGRVFKEGLKEREKVMVEGPLGTFFLREDSAKPIILLASGTGYAPIRSLVLDAFRRRVERSMTLYWGGRRRIDLYSIDEPRRWAEEHQNFAFIPVLSETPDSDEWEGRRGLVHRAVMDDFRDLSGHEVYACGAPVMVNAARKDFTAACQLPADQFFADSFITQADLAADQAAPALGYVKHRDESRTIEFNVRGVS